jgi:hypothetical protein
MRATIATSPARPDQPNEDFAAACATGAVLLDGAGLSGTTTKCVHGVAWYARHLGGALLAGLPDPDRPLPAVLADGIRETAALHADPCRLEDDPGTPSATVIMTRVAGARLEYLVLSDSVLLLVPAGAGAPVVITDNRADEVRGTARQQLDAMPGGTPEHAEALRRHVQSSWEYRNRPGGFWVAAADPSVADEAIVGDLPLGDVASVALLSDGASRIVDLFGLADWPGAAALLGGDGPDELIRRVRAAEDEDPRGARWPRGKAHDDATVAHCVDLVATA